MSSQPPLGFLMSHLGELLRERTSKELVDFGLSPREFGVLWRLDGGPLSQRQLGDLHRIDRSTVVAVIDRLEERGLVVREVDRQDRRRRALALTEHGRVLLAEAGEAVERTAEDFQSALSAQQRRQLHRLLTQLNDGNGAP